MSDRKRDNYGQREDDRRSRPEDLDQMEQGLQRELRREIEEESLRAGDHSVYQDRRPVPHKPGKHKRKGEAGRTPPGQEKEESQPTVCLCDLLFRTVIRRDDRIFLLFQCGKGQGYHQ